MAKRGYRFAPSVRVVTEESDAFLFEEQENLRIVVKDKIEERETSVGRLAAIAGTLVRHRLVTLASVTILLTAVAAG